LDKGRQSLLSLPAIPLVLAYIAFPLVDMSTRAMGRETFRSWIDIAWLLLSIMAIVHSLLRPNQPLLFPILPREVLIAAPIVFVLSVLPMLGKSFSSVTYAMEMKPILYIVVAWLWVLVFGFPSKRAFVQAGLCLSALIAAEFVISSVVYQTWTRPIGSGEINYDACLIVLSLCVAMADEETPRFYALLLFAGILATFSRTGVVVALLIVLVSRRVPRSAKLLAFGAAAVVSVFSFLIRGLELTVDRIDRYLMWTSALQLFTASPSGLIWGYGVGTQLPLSSSVPRGLGDLWFSQTDKLGLSGVYAFEYHAMWLRMTITWGIIVTSLVLIAVIALIFQENSLLRRYLAFVVLLEGFSMGLIYLSNVGVPLWILILLASRDLRTPRLWRRT